MELSNILSIVYSLSFATLFSINVYSLIKINKMKKMIQQLLYKYKNISKETICKEIQVDLDELNLKLKNSKEIPNLKNKPSKSQILPVENDNEEEIYNIINIEDDKIKDEKKIINEKPDEKKIEINGDIENNKKEIVKTEVNKGFFTKFFRL